MNKEYFIEKLDELKYLHQNKFKNIEEILEKCNSHEDKIYEKINHLNEENKNLLNLLKNVEDIFDMIIRELI